MFGVKHITLLIYTSENKGKFPWLWTKLTFLFYSYVHTICTFLLSSPLYVSKGRTTIFVIFATRTQKNYLLKCVESRRWWIEIRYMTSQPSITWWKKWGCWFMSNDHLSISKMILEVTVPCNILQSNGNRH